MMMYLNMSVPCKTKKEQIKTHTKVCRYHEMVFRNARKKTNRGKRIEGKSILQQTNERRQNHVAPSL